MSLTGLKEEVLAQADKKAAEAKGKYTKQRQQEQARIKTKMQLLEEEILAQGKREAAQEANRLHQARQLEAKAKVLGTKQQALDKVRDDFIQQLLAQDEGATKKLLQTLLESLPDISGEIIPGEKHANVLRGMDDTRHQVSESEVLPNEGGFVFRADKTEVNLTISFLVKQLFERHRAQIAHTLFG